MYFLFIIICHERVRFTDCLKVKRVAIGWIHEREFRVWHWKKRTAVSDCGWNKTKKKPTRQLRTGEKVEIIYALIALAVASKPVIDTYIEILIAKGCLRASRADKTRTFTMSSLNVSRFYDWKCFSRATGSSLSDVIRLARLDDCTDGILKIEMRGFWSFKCLEISHS